MSDIVDKVRELSRIKADIAKLNDRRKELEAYFLERGGDDVVDTKFKSTVYADPDSPVLLFFLFLLYHIFCFSGTFNQRFLRNAIYIH